MIYIADPKVILSTSLNGMEIRRMVLKWEQDELWGDTHLLNYVKNSYLFDKLVIELVAL